MIEARRPAPINPRVAPSNPTGLSPDELARLSIHDRENLDSPGVQLDLWFRDNMPLYPGPRGMGHNAFEWIANSANMATRRWIASGQCALMVPTNMPCSRYVPSSRIAALIGFVLPIATGYYSYRKSDGCWGWTAAGAAAGLLVGGPLTTWMSYTILRGGARSR